MKPRKVVDPKYNELHSHMLTVFKMHGSRFTAQELLAVASQIVGQLLALQDQRQPDAVSIALEVIKENIEIGNQHAIETALKLVTKGTA